MYLVNAFKSNMLHTTRPALAADGMDVNDHLLFIANKTESS
jgi:hypothetical protein